MDEQEKKEWIYHNLILQNEYNEYNSASSKQDKESALRRVEHELSWAPFTDYLSRKSAPTSGLSKYGIDMSTEKCIKEIDDIATKIKKQV